MKNAIRLGIVLCFACASVAVGQGARQVQITNTYNVPWKLSDLTLFLADGNHLDERLAGYPGDDEEFPAHATRTYPNVPTSSPITSYTISASSGTGATYMEWETWVFNVTAVTPRKLSFFSENSTNRPLVASIDDANAPHADLTSGTLYTFVNGASSTLPGWMLANSFDFGNGQLVGPFSGSAYVYESPFESVLVPEPGLWCALLAAASALTQRFSRRFSRARAPS